MGGGPSGPGARHIYGDIWRYPTIYDGIRKVADRYPTISDRYPTTSARYPTIPERYLTMSERYPTISERYPTTSEPYPTISKRYQTISARCMTICKTISGDTQTTFNDIRCYSNVIDKHRDGLTPKICPHNRLSRKPGCAVFWGNNEILE